MLINPNFDLLKPVRSDEFLPPIQLWVRLGGLALVGTAGMAIALISVIPYNIVVQAPATVRPSGEIRIVQAEVEGVVNRIGVKENQTVKQGDAIAYLDDSQSQTQRRQRQGNIQQSKLQLTQIAAQVSAIERQQAAESNVSDRSIAAAEADLSRSRRDFQDKQIAAEAELQEAQANVELAQEQLKRYQQLGSAQAISILQVKEKENTFKTALAQLQRAKSKVNPNHGAVTIAAEQIAQESARGKVIIAKLRQERESLVSKQVELENQLSRDRQALEQLDRDLKKNVVRATASGTILKLNLRNAGQVVHLGESVGQISPHQPQLIVKARVAAQDISQVKICTQKRPLDCQVGQAQLQISAYPYPDYGVLNGAVIAIAPDATTPNTTSSALSYYDVTIQPEKSFLVRGDRHYALQSGMEINANIISQKETVLTFLLRKARLLTHW